MILGLPCRSRCAWQHGKHITAAPGPAAASLAGDAHTAAPHQLHCRRRLSFAGVATSATLMQTSTVSLADRIIVLAPPDAPDRQDRPAAVGDIVDLPAELA